MALRRLFKELPVLDVTQVHPTLSPANGAHNLHPPSQRIRVTSSQVFGSIFEHNAGISLETPPARSGCHMNPLTKTLGLIIL